MLQPTMTQGAWWTAAKIISNVIFTGAGFNGRVNGFTCVDSARPVVDQ